NLYSASFARVPSLRRLSIVRCPNLVEFGVTGPELLRLDISECDQLIPKLVTWFAKIRRSNPKLMRFSFLELKNIANYSVSKNNHVPPTGTKLPQAIWQDVIEALDLKSMACAARVCVAWYFLAS